MENSKKQSLTIDVKFKVKDVLRYNMSVAWKSLTNKIICLLGIGILVYYFYKMFHRTVTLDVFIAQNILYVMVPILIFVLIPWRVWKVTVTQMQNPAFAYGVTYIFTEDAITLDLGEAKDEMPWTIFVSIVETKNDFRLFVDDIRAQLVPKHNLTKEQIVTFKELAQKASTTGTCKFK
ncbi:hypothetical protein CS063_00805 [Sporanaerobium hydrogeniformans]|uniref:Uncharacterized protein n=1 Tax=Sporanaerobium hydrogeniformans TaxID=3072179 RepID=A0AC61DGQ6_9FIRM|nr:YcxB family protein [Sporanaerobium hydrogeniformans]PHV72050.1 hypothetical protein CS063_00805 [Sporanaerobium hydrogeniformans]